MPDQPSDVLTPQRIAEQQIIALEIDRSDRDTTIERLRAENAALRKACVEALSVVDECYAATGHIRVAKTSQQRMKIEAALAGEPEVTNG